MTQPSFSSIVTLNNNGEPCQKLDCLFALVSYCLVFTAVFKWLESNHAFAIAMLKWLVWKSCTSFSANEKQNQNHLLHLLRVTFPMLF